MLKKIRAVIYPTLYINFKALRLNFMQYFMLVFIFPLTYLIVSLISNQGNYSVNHITGMFISMIISLFINMQATLVSSSNTTSVIELYSVFQVKPIYVFYGQCILHILMSLPLFFIMLIIVLSKTGTVSLIKLVLWLIITLIFLSLLAIYIGGFFKNPNLAGPMINMLYMIIIMTTPIYNQVNLMSENTKHVYAINPLTHLISLLYWSLEIDVIVNPLISFGLLILISVFLYIKCSLRWKDAKAIEKLNLF